MWGDDAEYQVLFSKKSMSVLKRRIQFRCGMDCLKVFYPLFFEGTIERDEVGEVVYTMPLYGL
jgi:hypothetical protein